MTAKAAVVGWPVEHSLSPVLHSYWLREYDIDGTYEKIAIKPGTFAQRIAELRAAGYRGVNVTVPFKEEAFKLATKFDDAALFAGAANLLIFLADGKIGARNTDIPGIRDSLMQSLGNISLGGKNIVLVGAGGAARAVAYALQALKVDSIYVLNRHQDRADELVKHIKKYRSDSKFRTGTLADWPLAATNAWLVINATSAGMKDNPPLGLDLSKLRSGTAVCDIVYSPLETSLLKDAKDRGLKTIDGLGMLMHQAAPSFQVFFDKEMGGKVPEVTQGLRNVLVKELQSRG